jgi:putative membrane protein
MHWDFGPGMGWMMVWWWLFWILIIAAVVWLLAKAVAGRATSQDDSPETILKRRYARGDVSRDEYDQRLKDLRK